MSQNDFVIANQGFASFRSDLNDALKAMAENSSGTSAPSTTYANMLWYDTTNNILKIRNEENDAFISLFTLDQANDNIESLTIDGALTAVGALSVKGGAVFNEDSADVDFRVESNNQANMFFVDGGNDIVSIVGGASYTVGSFKNTLQIEGTTGQTSSMSITRNTAGTSPPYLQFGKSRGSSVGANTIVQSGDTLGIITFSGADGTNRDTNGAMIMAEVDGTPGENDMPGRLIFKTTADGGSSTSERMRIHNGGIVSIPQGIALGVGTLNTASNVLDDYEEGSFTPAPSSGSIATKTGKYLKVGNLVHVNMVLSNFSGASSSAVFQIGGIPFTNNAVESTGSNYVHNVNTGTGFGNLTTYVYPSNTVFRLIEHGDDIALSVLTYNSVDSTSSITASFTYEIA